MKTKKVQLDWLDSVELNWFEYFKKTERNLQTNLFKKTFGCVIFLSMEHVLCIKLEINWNLINAFFVLFFICKTFLNLPIF